MKVIIINPRERERERERANLQSVISDLANKPNKTAEEEAELAEKRDKLKQLANNTQNNDDNSWIKPTLICCGGLLITAVIVAFIFKKNKQRNKIACKN